ncbi:MAG: CBS domain-containing protein [Proteobacteria bacterium]|nr:CBS domain-containing protein [Pseudomonadota bacterium]
MKIGDVMNPRAVRIDKGATLKDAAKLVSETQVSDLMVIDDEGNFVGVLSEGDLIRAALPGYDELMRDGASLGGAWKVFLEKGAELKDNKIDKLIIEAPVTLKSSEELIKAASAMINKQIRVLPVVDDGKLVGTISRGDLCHAVLGGS